MDNKMVENILMEFDKSNAQMTELFRIQNELSTSENELMALQIRFVHKNKENDQLRDELKSKSRLLNEKTAEFNCKLERFESLEFHYNDLIQKHKLCLECMKKQRNDFDQLQNKYEILKNEMSCSESDKLQIQEFFKGQIDDLDSSLKKLYEENEKNVDIIKELRKNEEKTHMELDKTKELNQNLNKYLESLKLELENFKEKYSNNLEEKSSKIEHKDGRIKDLELELSRTNSKADETSLQLNEFKTKHLNQLKMFDVLQKNFEKKELELEQLKLNYEKCYMENKNLNRLLISEKHEFETLFTELNSKLETNCKESIKENESYKKNMKTITCLYNNQQKQLENLVGLFRNQNVIVKTLKNQLDYVKNQFIDLKRSKNNLKSQNIEKNATIKNLQEKCFDLDSKYSEKCEHFNTLEKEIYLTRNSLDKAMSDLDGLTNMITNKNDEIIVKTQTINQLETFVSQLNSELTKRKEDMNARISQIETLDSHVKEEKNQFEAKLVRLEANLKSKSKQLNERIEQIKEMNEMVDTLRFEKDENDYKLQQYENLIDCQKLELDSKSSLLKQLNYKIQDMANELDSIKLATKQQQNKEHQRHEFRDKCCGDDIGIQMTVENKSTQCHFKAVQNENDSTTFSTDTNLNGSDSSTFAQNKAIIDELQLNLKIKENLIENINDALVLKEAEIARLKTRIGLMERKNIINEMSENINDI